VAWAGVWLGVVVVGVKAFYLGLPDSFSAAAAFDTVRSIAAISYVDVLFAAAVWGCGRLLLALCWRRRWAERIVCALVIAFSAISCLYAVANVVIFGAVGAFLTYPLLALVGSVRMVRSSVSAYLTPPIVTSLVGLPLAYAALVYASARATANRGRPLWQRAAAWASLCVWIVCGVHAYETTWANRQGRRIAQSPHWILLDSAWQALGEGAMVRLEDRFAADDLADFEPTGSQPPPDLIRRISRWTPMTRMAAARRPPNVILLVLESVAARWTSLNQDLYDSTPMLKAESSRSLIVENFYAHIGRSSNSLGAMLLSTYPKFDFRDLTEEYPRLQGTSLASVLHARGYRTAFVTSSDLSWAGWDTFLGGRGFDELRDYHGLSCTEPLSSWGVEDRCMLEAMIEFVGRNAAQPFFLMGWTQQTHHPYEPTPGVATLDLRRTREPVPDDYDLDRYLNVLHETDRHLGRLFDAIRSAGLGEDTIVVITGDHGQAFGYPHDGYTQGQNVYEEDVHVPLMVWYPRLYKAPVHSQAIGSHVDLAPTIAHLAGTPTAPEWQGHSLLDGGRERRAYFYVAENELTLGIREGNWKYIFNLRAGIEELYDLGRDPTEQHNLAASEPARCARLRQRLAAWTEANRRQYQGLGVRG
jgi:arylsulfatase A-like enzyme